MIDFPRHPHPRSGATRGVPGAELLAAFENGGPVQASLFRRLGDLLAGTPALHEDLVLELCSWKDDRLRLFLDAAADSEEPDAQQIVEDLLARRGLVGIDDWVERRLRDESGARWMVDVLAEVRDDHGTRLLLRLLDHPSNSIRRRAADGLAAHRSSLDGRRFVRFLAEPLTRRRSHPDPLAAVRALYRIADPALEPDFGRDAARRAERVLVNAVVHERRSAVRGDAIAALGDLGSRTAVRCLVDMLHREDEDFHRDVVIALRKIRPDRALIALIGLLRSRDPVVREEAANALGEIGDRQAVRRLRELLDDQEADVRQEAVLALGKLGGRDVLDALDRALSDSDPQVRVTACSALADSLEREAQGKLIRALHDGSADVRAEAAHLLGEIGDELAARHLRLFVDDDSRDHFGDRVGGVCRRALARIEHARRYGRTRSD